MGRLLSRLKTRVWCERCHKYIMWQDLPWKPGSEYEALVYCPICYGFIYLGVSEYWGEYSG